MTLTLPFWAQTVALLAVEATLVTAVAALLAHQMKPATGQRMIWQAAALGLLLVAACEVTGVSQALAGLATTAKESRQNVKVTVRTFTRAVTPPEAPTHLERPVRPGLKPASMEAFTPSTWWPAVLWLTGFIVICMRMAFARVLFLLIGKRRQTPHTDLLLLRVYRIARQLGLRRRVQVTESERLSSPIVFGIFRPGICLPTGFAQQFSVPQQEAILAHELAHVAARDPAWYCMTDAVTAFWWWHPLAWWSRRELHAASETAADEASLLVNDGPAALAECLVELGRRLTRTRSCGWLGVAGEEFRSRLGRRVTRLLSLRGGQWRERRAHIGLGVLAWLFMVLLAISTSAAWTSRRNSDRLSFVESWRDSMAGRVWKSLANSNQAVLFAQAESKPALAVSEPDQIPLVDQKTVTDEPAPEPTPDERRQATRVKLEQIVLSEVVFEGTPLTDVISNLTAQARASDPEGKGVNFIINATTDQSPPITDQRIRIFPALNNITLRAALEAVIKTADVPMKFSIEPYCVFLSPHDPEEQIGLYSRSFKVNPNTFVQSLEKMLNSIPRSAPGRAPINEQGPDEDLLDRLRSYFRISGIGLDAPKSMFFNDRTGFLRVRATLQDLDMIEQAMQPLNASPPQLTIEVKFVEVAEDERDALGLLSLIGYAPGTNGRAQIVRLPPSMQFAYNVPPAEFTGIWNARQYRAVVRALEERKGVDILSAPSVTTLSGRQAQIKVDGQYVNTDLPMEFGPMVDVVPKVLSDGYTISMTIVPTVKEFLGYHLDAGKIFVTGAPGEETLMPLPSLRVRQVVSSATAWDGQTVVVGVGSVETPEKQKPGRRGSPKGVRKSLFVLVTPTIVDPAGNRVHAPEDLPFRSKSVPPQKPAP